MANRKVITIGFLIFCTAVFLLIFWYGITLMIPVLPVAMPFGVDPYFLFGAGAVLGIIIAAAGMFLPS